MVAVATGPSGRRPPSPSQAARSECQTAEAAPRPARHTSDIKPCKNATVVLERGTKPLSLFAADEGAGKRGEGEVEVGTPLVAYGEAAEAGEPGQGALDDPAVATKALAGLDAASGDARLDPPRPTLASATTVIISQKSQGWSACSLSGRRRGRPRRPVRTPGTASSVAASAMLSWRLAPLSMTPSGVPRASILRHAQDRLTMWRLVPGLPLSVELGSVGFGPVASPPFSRARLSCPAPPATSPAHRRLAAAPAACGAAPPTRPPPAMLPAAASSSCRCSPAPAGARASTACRCAAQG